MPKTPDDPAYLARLQDHYARWRSLPAYGPLREVLKLASRDGVAKVLRRLQAAGFLDRSPDGRWTPTERFFERPQAEVPVPAGLPQAVADSGDARSIDAWLVPHPSRTVLFPVTGDSMIEAGIHPGDVAVVERDTPLEQAIWSLPLSITNSLSRRWRWRTAKPCCTPLTPLILFCAPVTGCKFSGS